MSSAALAIVPDERPHTAIIHPVLDAKGVMDVHNLIAEMVQKTLKEGADFGVIPGTKKPSLYKSGAERLCVGFGLVDTYEIIEKEIDHLFENPWEKKDRRGAVYASGVAKGLYRYTVKCLLLRREDNTLVAEGVGSCSSLESKYCDRPRDCENTILKMAKKRAKVDATLSGLGLSDRFTQDTEDTAGIEDEHGNADARPSGEEVKVQKPAAERLFPMKGPFQGKQIGEMPADAIRGYCEWITKKQAEKGDETFFAELLDALSEVLAVKLAEAEKDQTKLELDGPAAESMAARLDREADEEDAAPASVSAKKAAKPIPADLAELKRWNLADLQATAIATLELPAFANSRSGHLAEINAGLNHKRAVEVVAELAKALASTPEAIARAKGRIGDLPGDPA